MVKILCTIGGMLIGGVAWCVMIAVTSGVCAVPYLSDLWCTVPLGGKQAFQSINLWDWFLLVVFVIGGASAGGEFLADEIKRARR